MGPTDKGKVDSQNATSLMPLIYPVVPREQMTGALTWLNAGADPDVNQE